MQWLKKIADQAIERFPDGELLVESGASPSGSYHFGALREIITCDAIVLELQRQGRQARHIHFVDDLDALRKLPVNVPAVYQKYLGQPLCDIPAPDGSEKSYADYFLGEFLDSAKKLGIKMEVVRSHQKYRRGFFAEAIEKTLENEPKVRSILERVSGHKIEDNWSPVQIMEGGYLKSRRFISLDKAKKELVYENVNGDEGSIPYDKGEVKLNWRVDWPARWWLLGVNVEPAGRDHSSAGGSFDTGLSVVKEVFGVDGPLPVPYDFVNLAGDTKKMSASKGTGVSAVEAVEVMPPEVVRFFMLRFPPSKRLYLDTTGIAKLIDDYEALVAKNDKSEAQEWLVKLCSVGDPTVINVPFSHLVASYQASLKNQAKTISLLKRTSQTDFDEHAVKDSLTFVDNWLEKWAPEEVKFQLVTKVDPAQFSETEKAFLDKLADKIEQAPADADGEWFHKAIYDLQAASQLEPQAIFQALYRALIGKTSGPRAGWFLSILPRDWLVKRLRFEQ